MGGAEEEEAWFVDGLQMGRIRAKGIVCHTVVLGTTCLTRGT